MSEMRRVIDKGLRNELDSKGYLCPQCRKTFQTLEVDRLMNFALGTFNCDVCGAELVDNENAENVVGSQDRMQRFNRQMRFILEGLRRTEELVLPVCVPLFLPSPLSQACIRGCRAEGRVGLTLRCGYEITSRQSVRRRRHAKAA